MAHGTDVDVSEIVDAQRLRAFNVKLLAWSFLLLLTDGYDFAAAGFAAPSLIKAWNIQNLAVLGPVFSASLLGIALGAPLLGYLADRIGRKTVLVSGTVIFGLFTLVSAGAGGIPSFLVLRFLAGIGLGGVMPISITLNAEYAPRRVRATFVSLMFTGLAIGVGLPGLVAAWLVPVYGWPIIFLIGGGLPIVLAACVALTIPESVKYLVLRGGRQAEIVSILAKIAPDRSFAPTSRFVLRQDGPSGTPRFKDLFAGGLAVKTPLLWIMFATVGMTLYFIQTWLPTLLGAVGIPAAQAALATTLYQLGSVAGTLLLGWPTDRHGAWPLSVAILLAAPIVAILGTPDLGEPVLMTLLLICGALIIGTQNVLNAFTSTIYPAFIRANGVGSCLAIARLGSISGTIVGGFLVAAHLPLRELFFITAAPLVIAAVVGFLLARIHPVQTDTDVAVTLPDIVGGRQAH